MNERITRQLREAAEAHRPDRGRMLARVERGVAADSGRRRTPGIARSWSKVTLVGVTAAGILATAGLAVAGLAGTAPPPPDNLATPAVSNSSDAPPPAPPAHTTGKPAPQSSPSRPDRPAPDGPKPTSAAGGQVADGPLSAKGSLDPDSNIYWDQSRLVLDTTQPLTTLTVELRIAQTGGVRATGQWQTGPGDDFTVTVEEIGGAVVYRWELEPDRTVPAGQHFFAVQYNHAAGPRDARADHYDVRATAAGGAHAVRGSFTSAG